jgi:predicted RND superfamily exporter protein
VGDGHDEQRWWYRLVSWPLSRPVVVLAITAILCAAAVFRVSRMRPEPGIDAMFPENSPAAQALARVMHSFGAAEEMLLLATLPGNGDAPPDPSKLLAFAGRLKAATQTSPDASRLCGGVEYRIDDEMRRFFEKELVPAGLFYLSDDQLADARQRLTPAGMREQIARNEAMVATPGPAGAALAKVLLKDPLRLHEFVMDRLVGSRPFRTYENGESFLTPDGRSLLIRVRGVRPPSDIEYSKEFTRVMQGLAASVNTDGLTLDFAGSYPIAAASERAIRHDMIVSVTGSVVLLQLLFVLAYRKPFRLFALAFAPVAIGVLVGFAANSFFQTTISPMAAVIGAILAGLAIDYSVYVLSDYEAHRGLGLAPREAARATLLAVTPAIFTAWFTTAVGFVAVGWSSIPAIRDFARIGTLGLTGAFASALLVLPAVMAVVDRRTATEAAVRPLMRLSTRALLDRIARHRRGFVFASVALLAASALVLLSSRDGVLPLENDLTAMHPRPNAALDAQRKISARFGSSPDALLLHVSAASPEDLVTISHAARNRLADAAVRRRGDITGTFGLADLLPDPARVGPILGRIKDLDPAKVAADFRAAIDDSSFAPEPYRPYADFLQTLLNRKRAPTLTDLMNYPSLARNLLPSAAVRAGTPPTEALMLVFVGKPLDKQADRTAAVLAIRGATADLPGVTLTGMGVIGHDVEAITHHDLPRLIGIAAAVVAAYLLVFFRSLRSALLAVLPMLGGLLILLAAARLADQRLNVINLIAAPLLIGVDVDYGIFLVSLAASRKDFTRASLARRLDSGAYAVLVCAASALLGFGSLYFTSVPAIQSLGFAVGVGIAASLALTLFLRLPLLFAKTATDPGV